MATYALEVVYRGIFQKSLASRICRNVVLAARKEGRTGIAFSRYSDSPERNGIPAKRFAIVADDGIELEASMAMYCPAVVDATVVLDDTLCKGIESWAWDGLTPINRPLKEMGVLLVITDQSPEELLQNIHRKDVPYQLVVTRGEASLCGLWSYKDDHTDVRILGALAQVCPQLVSLNTVEELIAEEAKKASAIKAAEEVIVRVVAPGEGNPEEPYRFELPMLEDMEEGLVVKGQPVGGSFRGEEGGYQSARNPLFKKYPTRTMRPIRDFAVCTQCSLCWLHCPEGAYDVTPDGYYDVDLNACAGCGKCEEVCEAENCLFMVNEAAFTDNASQYELWKKDPDGYQKWFEEKVALVVPRSHGFHHKGQYKEELARKGIS